MSETMSPSLLQRVAHGDSAAVDEVVSRYGGLVWSIAKRFSSSNDDAEDAVQEAFIDIWKHADRFDPALGSETTFIATLSRRRCIDRLRAQGRRPKTEALPAIEVASSEDPFAAIIVADEAAHVARHLATLRPEQRQVLELAVYHGWSHRMIADQLALPLGTVKTHVRRALIKIRELLVPGSTEEGSVD
jgi:RNA polymerase sigma-70 factor (ECF subfamily)